MKNHHVIRIKGTNLCQACGLGVDDPIHERLSSKATTKNAKNIITPAVPLPVHWHEFLPSDNDPDSDVCMMCHKNIENDIHRKTVEVDPKTTNHKFEQGDRGGIFCTVCNRNVADSIHHVTDSDHYDHVAVMPVLNDSLYSNDKNTAVKIPEGMALSQILGMIGRGLAMLDSNTERPSLLNLAELISKGIQDDEGTAHVGGKPVTVKLVLDTLLKITGNFINDVPITISMSQESASINLVKSEDRPPYNSDKNTLSYVVDPLKHKISGAIFSLQEQHKRVVYAQEIAEQLGRDPESHTVYTTTQILDIMNAMMNVAVNPIDYSTEEESKDILSP